MRPLSLLTRVTMYFTIQSVVFLRVKGGATSNYSGTTKTVLDKPRCSPSFFTPPLDVQAIIKSYQRHLPSMSWAPISVAIISCPQSCKFQIYVLPNRGLFLKYTFNHLTLYSKFFSGFASFFFLKKQVQAPQSGPHLSLQCLLSSPLFLITLEIYATAKVKYFRFPVNCSPFSSRSLYTCSAQCPKTFLTSFTW